MVVRLVGAVFAEIEVMPADVLSVENLLQSLRVFLGVDECQLLGWGKVMAVSIGQRSFLATICVGIVIEKDVFGHIRMLVRRASILAFCVALREFGAGIGF